MLAGVPLALTKVQEAAFAILVTQFLHQFGGVAAFGGAEGIGVPFRSVAVAGSDEGGFTAHGQAHVTGDQFGIHLIAQGHHVGPLLIGIRFGDARGFVNAGHAHVVAEGHFALVHAAFHGGCTRRLRRASQRNMTFTGHQARGGVKANPACAGQVNLAPCVQIGEVHLGAAGAIERFHIGFELNQVTRDKSCSQPQAAHQLHQQPAGVAARA